MCELVAGGPWALTGKTWEEMSLFQSSSDRSTLVVERIKVHG